MIVYFGSETSISWSTVWDPKGETMAEIAEAPVVEEPEQAPRWELAECSCPDWCERDHEQD
jgi:hypothetical protein